VIFGELTQGRLEDTSRAEYIRIIDALRRDGCDAVALSCTEIPLLVTPDVSPLPTLDSTRLLARAAVETALGERTATWRGGALERFADRS
jgi:aspartate racemase